VSLTAPKEEEEKLEANAMDADQKPPKLMVMTDEDLDAAREKMCRWIYHSATPFTVGEDPFFRAFLKMLHPGFVPPTRLDIANKYLDREQARLQDKVDTVRMGKGKRQMLVWCTVAQRCGPLHFGR